MTRRSKIEIHAEILIILANQGPLKPTQIMYKTNTNRSALKEYLGFLTKQGLVEKCAVGKWRVVYAITQNGAAALKHFKEFKKSITELA